LKIVFNFIEETEVLRTNATSDVGYSGIALVKHPILYIELNLRV